VEGFDCFEVIGFWVRLDVKGFPFIFPAVSLVTPLDGGGFQFVG